MAKQRETLFKEEVIHQLKQLNKVWFVKVQQVAIRGTPDILLCVNGHFVALELKTADGKVDKLQNYTLAQIRKAGGISLVVTPDNFHEAFDILEHISHGGPVHPDRNDKEYEAPFDH